MKKPALHQNGFTLVELAVSIGLMGLFLFAGAQLYQNFSGSAKRMSDDLENYIDDDLGKRVILRDLKGIDPSFGAILLRDDHQRNFFDFVPDQPDYVSDASASRSLTLKVGGTSQISFLTLTLPDNDAPLLVYDPAMAYTVGTIPADPNQAATLAFKSVNQNSYISDQRPEFWEDGQLLMFDTPALLRPVEHGRVNYTIPPRSPLYVGRVKTGGAGSLVNVSTVDEILDTRLPNDPGNRRISSADDFFRWLPPMGGGQPLVRLRPVTLVRYRLEKIPQKADGEDKGAILLKETLLPQGGFSRPFQLATGISAVKFERRSVGDKAVYYNFQRPPKFKK